MTANMKRETAKIYIFPVKSGANSGMLSKEAKWDAEIAAMGADRAVTGSSWYHEEAVKAADPRNTRQ
ncbi:DUF2735 domain-containing protein [Xanthobacter autotrophicus DSM 431]|uniref:DUF2735 domain-containing protein n=1 Tax=Xanthobacter nonsaccharivorans TaxID=3119912 RepID=UPI0037273554